MNIQTFYPRHPILKDRIEYYYFVKADAPDFQTTYYAFPNVNIPLSLHRSAEHEISDNYTRVQAVKNGSPLALVQRSFQQPLLVYLLGPIDKVTIGFKPLGLNSFVKRAFKEIAPHDSQEFKEWDVLPGYPNFHQQFFLTNDHEEKVSLLEEFLLTVFDSGADDGAVKKSLSMLSDFDESLSVDEIAARLGLSTRSFNRLFQQHMSISPVAWKKIARFRHSLENKLFSSHFKKLTEIGYDSNFYDQAYFIKFYRKLTGSNPTNFFKSIDKLANDKLIFRFVTTE